MHRFALLLSVAVMLPMPLEAASPSPAQVRDALQRSIEFFHGRVARHGGYVYYVSPDLTKWLGEGVASPDQIWVQPPGTPTVGRAFLRAYETTGEAAYLEAADDAGRALLYGQLQSGGWTNCIDFDPRGTRVADYRNGRGRGKNYSTLDDGITQAALQFLMRLDQAHRFRDEPLHEAVRYALDALLAAQFTNGGFPQVWDGPVEDFPVVPARYPDHDWKTEGRIKNYWDMYTLNDGVAGTVTATLQDAHRIYGEERVINALEKFGDFLLLARMPEPQPAWAQQYNRDMEPIWARKFEPPAIAGRESQDVLHSLLVIAQTCRKARYLRPIPRSLSYLRDCLLPKNKLARYYELRTNEPLYMKRRGDTYTLTHDDSDLPDHYGWKTISELDVLSAAYESIMTRRGLPEENPDLPTLTRQVARVLDELDAEGRWITRFQGERLVGQPKFQQGEAYVNSAVFSRNIGLLCDYLERTSRR